MAGTSNIITIDMLTEQAILAKADWIAVLNNSTKKTGKASFKAVIELLKGDFYTKTEILDLIKKGQSGGAFDWNRAITQGTYAGIVPGGATVVEGLENLFYAAQAPSCGMYADNNPREYGAPTDVTLHYGVTPRTNTVQTIVVDGNAIALDAFGNLPLSGAVPASLNPNTNKSFYMSATDSKSLAGTAGTTVEFHHKRFWFTSDLNLLTMSEADISAYVVLTQSEFAGDRQQTRTFNAANEYIYFAWLADYGTAQFVTNGLGDTDFIQKSFAFKNSQAYTTNFLLVRKGLKLNNTFTIQVK